MVLLLAGCEMMPRQVATNSQKAGLTAEQRSARADAERQLALTEIEKIRGILATQQMQIAELDKRLKESEQVLAVQKTVDLPELASAVSTLKGDLKQLKGDHVGLDYRTNQRFEDVALIHANLEQADEDLRKHLATSVTNLERRCTKERDELAAELATRQQEQHGALVSSCRELERQATDDRARAAEAMRAVRDALASEQTAVKEHADRLTGAVADLDSRFGSDGDAARAGEAAEAFEEARRLHQDYMNERHRPELLSGAIDAYRRGLNLQPDAIEMHYELARLLRVARKADDAKPHLEYYLAHGDDPDRVAQARAWLAE